MKKITKRTFVLKNNSYKPNYCELITIDETNQVPIEEFEDLVVAYENNFFDDAFEELKEKFPKLQFRKIINGCTLKVLVTKRSLLKRDV